MMYRLLKIGTGYLLVLFALTQCIVIENQFSALPPGEWRAVLQLEPNLITPNPKGEPLPEKLNLQFEEVSRGELPFNFEVIYDDNESFHIEIINGEERIRVDDITIGLDRSTAKDTLILDFPVYDSYIKAIYEEKIMEGKWVVNNRGTEYSIPFIATHGEDYRFTQLKKEPMLDVSGKWEATFDLESENPYKAIGEFQQEGNAVTGTFRTETGDYRYLDGTIQDNKLYLSVFDGAHAFLFEAKILPDSTMIGSFRSGKHYRTTWEAKRNPDFELKDPNELTYLKEGYDRFEFSFENTAGELVSLSDPQYQDKVVLVQIFGTWCPNCRDETIYLTDYLKKNPSEDLEVVALAFEKYREKEKAIAAIERFKEGFDIPYELLLAGYYNKSEAAEALPMLNHVLSYPTMIFIDKSGAVRRIHTGFNGPATSKFDAFKEDFEGFVAALLNEPT
ncbi:MAG: TlpA disulfide reductase family protein [Bacteroidota bacterium]